VEKHPGLRAGVAVAGADRSSTARLACRRSRWSLLPLAHPAASLWSAARVGTFTGTAVPVQDVLTDDELAGIVDLFGALRRPELAEAVSELAYRRGTEPPDAGAAVEAALSAFVLVAVPEEGELLAVGPAAFPTLPEGAEDLPHILDVEPRSVDRERVGRVAERRLRGDAARAVATGDADRIAAIRDVTYDLEAWAPIELAELRGRLDDAVDGTN